MEDILNESEIEEIINELNKGTYGLSIIEKSPKDIEEISDGKKREKEMERFKIINDLYVKPLEDLLNCIGNNQTGKYGFDYGIAILPIIERIKVLSTKLVMMGVSLDQMLQLVPKNVSELREKIEEYEHRR